MSKNKTFIEKETDMEVREIEKIGGTLKIIYKEMIHLFNKPCSGWVLSYDYGESRKAFLERNKDNIGVLVGIYNGEDDYYYIIKTHDSYILLTSVGCPQFLKDVTEQEILDLGITFLKKPLLKKKKL